MTQSNSGRNQRQVALAASAANARALLRQGRLAEARAVSAALLDRNNEDVEAWRLLAVACALAKDFVPALAAFRRAAQIEPTDARTLHDLGVAQHEAGRPDEAAESFRRAVAIQPLADWYFDLGNALALTRSLEAALDSYRRAVELKPRFADALCNLGCTLNGLGRYEEAVEPLQRALGLTPASAEVHTNLGEALRRTGRIDEAVTIQRRALQLGASPAVHNNLGNALVDAGEPGAAVASFRAALAQRPRDVTLQNNLANALQQMGLHGESITAFEQALALDPDSAIVRYNLGMALLKAGDFARGWEAYESRFARSVKLFEPAGCARWDGNVDGLGARLVLVTEQGLGDAIQFVRYGALLNARGIRPTLQCDVRLSSLLASCGYFEAVVPHGHEFPVGECVWYPLMSLPHLFRTQLDTIPAMVPYLTAEPERVQRWKSQLDDGARGLRVGIAWQGNPEAEKRGLRGRSVPLRQFGSLAAIDGVTLVNLQVGHGLEQVGQVDFADRLLSFGDELDQGAQAFLDTAALLLSLDLVITSDTALAHLAGALGRPAWVALHARSDWRWLTERHDSPWYPSLRMFRQSRPDDWDGVFAEIAWELAVLAADIAENRPPQQNRHTP